MRMIDSDLFVNHVKSGLYVNLQANAHDVIDAVNDEPTLLRSAPIGEWLEDSGNIACSNCHIIWLYGRTYFCPNCGAYMEDIEHDNRPR